MARAPAALTLALGTVTVLCGLGKCGALGPSVGEKLKVVSAPEGATVSIDGEKMGETPLTLTDLDVEEGQTQVLEFELEGHMPVEKEVTWTMAEQSVAVTLEEAEKERVFTVKTIPSGASLFVDGLSKGESPMTFSMEMKNGEGFNLLLQHRGYDDITEKVEVDGETMITLRYNFKREGGKAHPDLDEVLVETEKKWRRACKTIKTDHCTFEYQIGSAGNVTDVEAIKCNYRPVTKCTKRWIRKMVFPTEGNARSDIYTFRGAH